MLRTALLSLRSAGFYLGYVSGTIVMSTVFILLAPLLPSRSRYLYTSAWCTFVLFWLRLCCGVRHQITGKENLPEGPVVLLANHQSSWETILFYQLVFPVAPILKKELMNIPFWGWALRLQKPIAIDRSKPREAGKSLLTQGVKRIGEGFSVIVFPEGTRSAVNVNKRFSRGGAKLAIAAGVPIVPVAHNAGHCWPPRGFLKYPGLISVVIGKALPTTDANASDLTEQSEAWIRAQTAEFQLPKSL